jgi:hypothetical protein
MNLIKYKDAEIIDLSVEMCVVRKVDGWYIIGDGVLIKVNDQQEGKGLKKVLTEWFKKNREK